METLETACIGVAHLSASILVKRFPQIFFKKSIMGFCRYDYSEQLFLLELLLKMRSYSSGNQIIFCKMSGFSLLLVRISLGLAKFGYI